jgi:predicted Zn-dependent protease
LIQLVTVVDDRPVFFWLNGARMLAYDMTQWRLARAGAAGPPPAAVRQRIAEEQAAMALRYLEEARRRHPDNAALCVEVAHIHYNLRADVAAAARWYRQAAELPDAPRYAARIHAQLLRRLGRPREAYRWLCRLHATLPARDPEAMPEVVLKRIRDLEETLAIPAAERYAAPAAPTRASQ